MPSETLAIFGPILTVSTDKKKYTDHNNIAFTAIIRALINTPGGVEDRGLKLLG